MASEQSKFYKELCSNSINKDPKLAVLEWDFLYSYEENNKCICGQIIFENCLIQNKHNKVELIIGNVCINKFLDKDYTFLFKGIKSIKNGNMPNKSFLSYCYARGYINLYCYDFLNNIFRKKKLTEKQRKFKKNILNELSMRNKW